MSYYPTSIIEIFFVALFLASFCVLAWRRIDWGVALVVFLLPTYLIRFSFWFPVSGFDEIPTTLLEIMIYIVFCVWLKETETLDKVKRHIKSLLRSKNNPWREVYAAVGLIVAGAIFSALFSEDKIASFGLVKGLFIDSILFLVVLGSLISWKRITKEHVLKVIVLSGVFVSIISLEYYISHQLTYDGRLRAFYNSPNQLAMFLSPLIFVSLYGALIKKAHERLLWVGATILLVLVVYLTESVGAWVGVFAGMLVGAVLYRGFLAKYRSVNERPWYMRVRGVFVSIVILLVLLSFFSQVLTSGAEPGRGSFTSRVMIWRTAGYIIQENAILGIGLGGFQKQYLLYQDKFQEPYLEWAVPHPHNVFLAFWLGTGLLGFFGLTLLLTSKLKESIRQLSKKNSREAILVISVLTYILIHGLVDTLVLKNDLAILTGLFFLL